MATNLEALAAAYGWTVDGDTYKRDGETATIRRVDGKVEQFHYSYNGRSTTQSGRDLTREFLELITPRPDHSIAES